ncbi:myb/SANT-like DNA-binding domain-containing protein 3 [Colias croceus]|uniref:myb/SANT-like DNA-binding domain-containing protein 3 n=1 Tax=Colias crocea TaxID=72248 RepID=UPI001E2809CC|nr:myb/SANT-like DNA-binding domain-containing protein 3 [Colias croceus]
MEKQKRERSTNFSQDETHLLLSLIEARRYIIESKRSDASTWQEKEKAWKDIEKAFNSVTNSVFRDHKHLKIKYEAIKRDTRKKIAEFYKSGGTKKLTIAEEKVKEIMRLSVDSNESQFDSDSGLPSTTHTVIKRVPGVEESNAPNVLTNESRKDNIIQKQESEPPKKKLCAERTPIFRSKSKEEMPFDELAEEKHEIAKIQMKIRTEELHQKIIQRKLLEQDLKHKDIIFELEKQQLLLKIQLLKKDLEKT